MKRRSTGSAAARVVFFVLLACSGCRTGVGGHAPVVAEFAPPGDLETVGQAYRRWPAKGALSPRGDRITILSPKRRYAAGEEIRVHHVHETTRDGVAVFLAGPKGVWGETVDGVPTTPTEPAGYGWDLYDGAVWPEPETDANYDVTVYRLPKGTHTIRWSMIPLDRYHETDDPGEPLVSNDLAITVE